MNKNSLIYIFNYCILFKKYLNDGYVKENVMEVDGIGSNNYDSRFDEKFYICCKCCFFVFICYYFRV